MDTPNTLRAEEVMYQQTYDYTWEANLEQNLAAAKKELIELKSKDILDCPPVLTASIISLITQMRFFLGKYNRDTEEYDNYIKILERTNGVNIFDLILTDIEKSFAKEAGYLLNFRAKTDKREDWENF